MDQNLSTSQDSLASPSQGGPAVSDNTPKTVEVAVWPTPNPNALKFILNVPLKGQGKSTFRAREECLHVPLAQWLFDLEGVENLHFFQNTVTVTRYPKEDWDTLEPRIIQCLELKAPLHDAHFHDSDPEEERRKNLSPEILEIEEILDRTIRPGLQGDGGDIVCVDFKDNVLLVKYQGACGTCPSSSAGTLEAIRSILKDELGRAIDVYVLPE